MILFANVRTINNILYKNSFIYSQKKGVVTITAFKAFFLTRI